MTRPSYDDIQINAQLVVCADCQRSFYMTHPKERCGACEQIRRASVAPDPPREAA